jgi:exonuclease III
VLLRIATFNLENFDDDVQPPLSDRIQIMRPQIERVAADILCLQEIHSQGSAGSRALAALNQLMSGTPHAEFNLQMTLTTSGQIYNRGRSF